jgi:phage terminase large subunit
MGEIRVNEKFAPLFEAPKTRYVLLSGGRGAAKSFAITLLCSRIMAEHHNQRILYTRYTMAAANDSVVLEFAEKIDIQNLHPYFTQKKNDVYCGSTGSAVSFRGLKSGSKSQTAKLKSIKANIFVLDEAEELTDEEEFDKIDLSIRDKNKTNLIILIMNPTNKNHWVYKRWIQDTRRTEIIDGVPVSISTHPDVTHIHVTYLDNKENLSESYLRRIYDLKANNPKKYAHYIIGQWIEKAEGVIYEDWSEGVFDEKLPYIYAMDFGYFPDPLALVKIAVDRKRKKIHLKELIYETELSNEGLLRMMTEAIPDKSKPIVSDTNEKRTVMFLRSKGFRVIEAKKGPNSIIQGIKDMKDYEIIVTSDSPNIKNELDNYVWADKKSDTPIDQYNHSLDAGRYGFTWIVKHVPRPGEMKTGKG